MCRHLLEKTIVLANIILARCRAMWFRIAGARIGNKCSLGSRVHLQRPWTISIGCRTTLESDVWLKIEDDSASVEIGQFTFLGRGCEIDCTKSVVIGDRCLIAPNVFITDHNHNIGRHSFIADQGCTAKAVLIGNDVWIGAHAVILPGVTLESGSVIAAGAVVTKNVPGHEVWAGIPARRISERR